MTLPTICAAPGCDQVIPCSRHARNYTVVAGPPCSGKSTYVQEHAKRGDLVVDFDRLAQAVGKDVEPYDYPDHIRASVREMRTALIRYGLDKVPAQYQLWVIDTAVYDRERTLQRYRNEGAEIVVLDPGMEVCLERAERERPPGIRKLIYDWYGASE